MSQETLEYFNGNNLPADTWKSKYALKNLDDEVLEDDPDDMHKRMAEEFGRISIGCGWDHNLDGLSDYGSKRGLMTMGKAYSYFANFEDIIPQGSIMSGLGDRFRYKSLSNCVVLNDVVDSYGGICYTDEQLAQLMKRRCGVGVDISNLRPRGTLTKNAANSSSGTVSFLKRFSDTTNEVAQEGRRGALMVTLDCRHPDVMEFISSKDAADKITGANISVKWTEDFIDAAKNNREYVLRWPVDEDPEDAEITKTVDASEVFAQAAMYAHGYDQDAGENASTFGGDPGCMFIDRMIEYSTDCGYPGITVLSTNPCGEIGMHNDCCRLIALNFISAVNNPFESDAEIIHQLIYELAYEQQILLDNLVDLEIEHIDRILDKIDSDPEDYKYKRTEIETWRALKDNARLYRRTGGGFTALGDALAAVGVEYGSEYGNHVVDRMMQAKFRGEWDASIDLSIQRGCFPQWKSEWDDTEFFDMMEEEFPEIYERNMRYGRRNISLSTVAPTGSVSLMAHINGDYGTSSGIEPVFSTEENVLWHTRNKKVQGDGEYDYVGEDGNKWKQYKVFHNGFRQYLETNSEYDNPESLSEDVLKEEANESPYVTSAGLDYEQRIELQSIVQKYTTHSISSTLNLPEDAHWEDTLDIYEKGYQYGLKGVTIFRNGSKRGVLESSSDNNSDNEGRGDEITYHDAPERPDTLEADVYNPRNNWIIVVGLLNDKPYEVFSLKTDRSQDWSESFEVYKQGSRTYNLISQESEQHVNNILSYSASSDIDVLTRFTSQLMRHGVKMDYIVEQVKKADITVNDFSNILAGVLEQYTSDDYTMKCGNCGSENVAIQEGCRTCQECGSSRCG